MVGGALGMFAAHALSHGQGVERSHAPAALERPGASSGPGHGAAVASGGSPRISRSQSSSVTAVIPELR